MKLKITILVLVALAVITSFWAVRSGNLETYKIALGGSIGFLTVLLIIAAALTDSINPCAFSVLLLTIAFLFSLGRQRSGIIKIGAAYIFSIFAVYILIGLGILKTLYILGTPHFMARVGGSIILAAGIITLLSWAFPNFPIKLKIPQFSHKYTGQLIAKGSFPAALLMGAVVALFEFPCTGGPYLFVLGLLHDQATYWQGFGLLLMYNLIFILPLVIILVMASDKNLLEKAQQWKKYESKKLRLASGLVMLLLGLAIFLI